MSHLKQLFEALGERLVKLAERNAVVSPPVSVGDRHVIPLCELGLGFAGGGIFGEGSGEERDGGDASGLGTGGGAGGGAKARPIAVVVIDNGKVSIQRVG